MTRRIWTKPFIKYNLSGDRTVAKSLERRARACVGYLFDQLMPNQKFRSQNWNYPDGSRITAFVWRDMLGERARVEMFAPEFSSYELMIGQLWSGLAYPAQEDWYMVDPLTGFDYRKPTIWVGKTAESHWSFSSFTPGGVTIARAPDSKKPERIHPAIGTSTIGKVPYQNIEQYGNTNLPGSFSGKMRKIVQRMLGAGRICHWRSRWGDCCWCFETADGNDWVIHLSDVYGLCAAPIEYIKAKEETVASGPNPNEHREKWTTLLTVTDLGPYLSTSKISFDIGFAANSKGNVANNISVVGYTVSEDGQEHVKEWEITISEGLDNGVYKPLSAQLAEISDDIAWLNDRGRIRFPNGMGLSTTVAFGNPENTRLPPRPDSRTKFKWPLYVYYDNDEIQRYYVNFEYVEISEQIPPEPIGMTDADVWKANGYDVYPYSNSFPVNGTGSFDRGGNIYYRSKFYFTGPGLMPDVEQSTYGTDTGTLTFALEVVDDASGGLVSVGAGPGASNSGIAGGGPVYAARRYAKSASGGWSKSVAYAAWIPNGDREAILFLKRNVDITQGWRYGRSTRYGHMFYSGAREITGFDGTAYGCCSGLAKKKGGQSYGRSVLPSPVDLNQKWSGGWNSPDGICPVPWYQEAYVCESQRAGNIIHTSSYDETFDEQEEVGSTTVSGEIYLHASGISSQRIYDWEEQEEDSTMSWIWLQQAVNATLEPPLYVNRTYRGVGIYQAFPATAWIEGIGGCATAYVDLFKEKGGPCLWVGEPEI